MNKKILLILVAILAIPVIYFAFFNASKPAKVLVFSKTEGYRHAAIPDGIAAIQKLGVENGFEVDTTEDATYFTEQNLRNYNTVIFLNTTGDIFNDTQQIEFQRYIQAGGGFVGIHSATDTEYDWPWYGELVGAYFNGHPKIQDAELKVLEKEHAATKALPFGWKRSDEWYNYKNINPNLKVLVNLDETSYEGGTNGESHPIAWVHEFDGGRVFYTGMGHTAESYKEPLYLNHLMGGITYALGKKKALTTPSQP